MNRLLIIRNKKINSKLFSTIISNKNQKNTAKIVEVGVRDGLQNESMILSAEIKLELINKLQLSNVKYIEAGAFVSPKWVPQMATTTEIFTKLQQIGHKNTCFSALTPNIQGYNKAIELGVKEVAVFGAASETFSRKNINCSINESLDKFKDVCESAKNSNNEIKVRGYISCVLGCPYEGNISPDKVIEVAKKLLNMGCYEISLGDTIGIGNPGKTKELLKLITKEISVNKLAVHFHDTYGQALANIYVALEHNITTIDSSISGLGGCPYASGASGNVATEDVVYMLHGLGIDTGINMDALLDAADFIDNALNNRKSASKCSIALRNKRNKNKK